MNEEHSMKRLLVLIVMLAPLCWLSLGCGSGGAGGPSGGHLKLTDEQMKQAKEAQMKAMMQKGAAPAAKK
jgi:hypothetical protein